MALSVTGVTMQKLLKSPVGFILMICFQRKEAIMIKPVTMYSVVCDRCGKTFIDEFNGIEAWLDEGTAKEQAMESEWAEIGDKHYCPDCYEFNDELDEYVPKMIYRNDVLGNPLVKGAKVLCRNFEFDISHIWRIGYFKGETTDKRFPYIVMVNGDSIAYSDCLAYTDSTKMLEGVCTRYISHQWQLDAAIKDIKELNKL